MKLRLSPKSLCAFVLALACAIFPSHAQQQALEQQQEQTIGRAQIPGTQQIGANEIVKRQSKPANFDRIAEKLKVAAPQTHANLSVFLIEGDDQFDTKKVLTLAEALGKKGAVVVKETSNVNELTVQNKDKAHTVFIMAGDIVKGGKQDRTLATDLPLMTKAGTVPVGAFCVEQGRWRARGGESVQEFSSSANAVATKDGKIALRSKKEQGEVWRSVAKAQEKITANVGKPVAAAASPTSLQLSLEDKELKKRNAEFIEALKPIVEKNERAIGFVCVINGQINSAEIFAGHDLFRRAWPKLLEATATEAISEQKEKAASEPVTVEKAMDFIAVAEDASATKEQIHGSFWNVSGESETTLVFQTIDEAADGRWLRRTVIKK